MHIKNVEDIYPLSPMQQGMLFQTLLEPHTGAYCEQHGRTFRGPFQLAAYQQAWQMVVDHHPILRTAFVWEGFDEPLQIVRQHITLAWDVRDWRHLSPTEQDKQLAELMQEDRTKGFELAKAPLMRWYAIQLSPDRVHCLWSYHHLLADGTSTSIILHEALTCYYAICNGQTPVLPNHRPFRDYVAWLKEQDMAKAEAFWRKHLDGFTASVPLAITHPAKKPDDSKAAAAGEWETYLPHETTEALLTFARQHQLTLNTLVQAAWALLLSRYSGETDIVFGITVSSRPHTLADSESMIGLFINTLPLRVQVPPESSALNWLQSVQNAQVEVRQYDYTPLVEAQRWSSVPRGQPLFESLLVYENYAMEDTAEGQNELSIERIVWGTEKAAYPLSLTVAQGAAFMLRVGYDPQKVAADSVHRVAGHLQQILQGIIANPDQRVGDISIITPEERRQLLFDWNQPLTAVDERLQNTCFHQIFERQADLTPDAIALTFDNRHVTYAELNARANQLARALQRQGAKPETLIGICVDRSFDFLIGMLGILKAGGAYTPLDPAYPADRLAYMLSDAHIHLLLANTTTMQCVQQAAAHLEDPPAIILLDDDWARIAEESADNVNAAVTPEQLAYVIYTSGSTGLPKGTLITHAGIGNLANAQIQAFGVSSASRTLQFASYSFDAAVSEIAMALLSGATLVLCEDRVVRSSPDLMQELRAQAISVVTLPPSLLAVLPAETLPDLQTLVTAGEKCEPEWLARWASPGRRLCNAYGPSETTVCATILQWDGVSPLTIGQPISYTGVYIVDNFMQPAPIGVTGTLYVSGVGLARGYLNQPELTAARFISCPASLKDLPAGISGGRLYNTGDLARRLSDGSIEFIGRQDDQIKLRGFRIELHEIESALMTHPAIQAAVVIVRQGAASEDKTLAAYVVFQNDNTLTAHEMYTFVQRTLPAYMIPASFTKLDALPLSPNGKIDRRALPDPHAAPSEIAEQYIAPHNQVEEEVAEIWEAVLGIPKISVTADFFELGGHSLLATQVISRIREQFQIELPVWAIFESSTIVGLAQAIIVKEIESADGASLAKAMEHLE